MKKRVSALALIAAAVTAFTTPSFAVFSSKGTVVSIASATVGGVPVVAFSLNLRNASNPLVGPNQTEINWSGVQAGDNWKIASQVLLINSTVTFVNGGIQIYTDNTASGAIPQFQDPTPGNTINTDSNPAGLLRVDGTGFTGETLPMAWSIKTTTQAVETAGGIFPANPNDLGPSGRCPTDPLDPNASQWLFMLDKATPAIDRSGNGVTGDTAIPANCPNPDSAAFINGDDFSTMIKLQGVHFGQGPTQFGGNVKGKDTYVYLQANFSTSLPQQTYRTNKLTVEAFTK